MKITQNRGCNSSTNGGSVPTPRRKRGRPVRAAELLTVADVAILCSVPRQTVYAAIHAGKLPAVQLWGSETLRIPRAALDAALTPARSVRGPRAPVVEQSGPALSVSPAPDGAGMDSEAGRISALATADAAAPDHRSGGDSPPVAQS